MKFNFSRLALAVLMVLATPASGHVPPSPPDYLFKHPSNEWLYAETLWGKAAPCTFEKCEAGYHTDKYAISAMRSGEGVQIVGSVIGCESRIWNLVWLNEIPEQDQPAVIRYLIGRLTKSFSEDCKEKIGPIPSPNLDPMFPDKRAGKR